MTERGRLPAAEPDEIEPDDSDSGDEGEVTTSPRGRAPRRLLAVVLTLLAVGGLGTVGWRWWSDRPPAGVVHRIRVGSVPVTHLVFSPTGKILAAGASSGEVSFISRDEWTIVERSAITTQPLTAMEPTHDGHLLAATLGERLLLWDWATLTSKVLPGIPQVPTSLAIHPLSGSILVGLRSGELWRLDVTNGESRTERLGQQAAVNCLVTGPRGEWLVSGAADGTVGVAFPDDPKREPIIRKEHAQPISAGTKSPSGRYVVTADWGGAVLVWSTADWTVKRRLEAGAAVSRVAMTETAIYAGDWGGSVHVWNADTGDAATPIECGYPVHGLAIDPKAEWLVTAGDRGWVDLRHLPLK